MACQAWRRLLICRGTFPKLGVIVLARRRVLRWGGFRPRLLELLPRFGSLCLPPHIYYFLFNSPLGFPFSPRTARLFAILDTQGGRTLFSTQIAVCASLIAHYISLLFTYSNFPTTRSPTLSMRPLELSGLDTQET